MPKKNSFVNDLILAPWWVSLILAGVIFLFSGIISGASSSNLGLNMVLTVVSGLAPWLAVFLLFISLLSFIRSLKVRTQLKRQNSVDTLNELS